MSNKLKAELKEAGSDQLETAKKLQAMAHAGQIENDGSLCAFCVKLNGSYKVFEWLLNYCRANSLFSDPEFNRTITTKEGRQ